MKWVAPDLRSIAAAHGATVVESLGPDQRRALERVASCQTEAMGTHQRVCPTCNETWDAYNSCRDRHCPRCLRAQEAEWFEAREAELLQVPYFHVVFTLPHELGPLALRNQGRLYGLLFRTGARTLLEVARNPRRLGAELGFFGVLHTWGRDLRYHPHVHWVVPGGGLAADDGTPEGKRWVSVPKASYFLPVQVLAKVFRGKFLEGLRELYDAGELELTGPCDHLQYPKSFENFCRKLRSKGWIVYAEPPFAGPEKVLGYLARYTHRTAISDDRILSCEDGQVTILWKDYTDGEKVKRRTFSAEDFLRRFALHVLPKGFVRIRYYGLLANRHRSEKLALCRRLLECIPDHDTVAPPHLPIEAPRQSYRATGIRCPDCGDSLEFLFSAQRPSPSSIRPFDRPRARSPP